MRGLPVILSHAFTNLTPMCKLKLFGLGLFVKSSIIIIHHYFGFCYIIIILKSCVFCMHAGTPKAGKRTHTHKQQYSNGAHREEIPCHSHCLHPIENMGNSAVVLLPVPLKFQYSTKWVHCSQDSKGFSWSRITAGIIIL